MKYINFFLVFFVPFLRSYFPFKDTEIYSQISIQKFSSFLFLIWVYKPFQVNLHVESVVMAEVQVFQVDIELSSTTS